MSGQGLTLGLDPAGLIEWAPFALVVDDDLRVQWASPSVTRRAPDAASRCAAELIRLPEAGSGFTSGELRATIGEPCEMALLAGERPIPLTGTWLEADTRLLLLARPRVSNREDLTLFDLGELDYTASILEVMVAADERTFIAVLPLEESLAMGKALLAEPRDEDAISDATLMFAVASLSSLVELKQQD